MPPLALTISITSSPSSLRYGDDQFLHHLLDQFLLVPGHVREADAGTLGVLLRQLDRCRRSSCHLPGMHRDLPLLLVERVEHAR